jgi:hypothetical protein
MLIYKTYDEDGEVMYKSINDFGIDENGNYYTVEQEFSIYGGLWGEKERVYHFFDGESNHVTIKGDYTNDDIKGLHTINSNYELWEAMGGIHSVEIQDGVAVDSESSHKVVTNFLNNICVVNQDYDTTNVFGEINSSQKRIIQPLKEMMIGYLANSSAVKCGASNMNSSKRWTDDKSLAYTVFRIDWLGIQMDSDHDVEELEAMTEPSQVITALESGGKLHKYSKDVYRNLGSVALLSSKLEREVVDNWLKAATPEEKAKARSDLQEVVGKAIMSGLKSRNNKANLTDDIMRQVEKKWHKTLDHSEDLF